MARIADYIANQYQDDPSEEVGIAGFTAMARVSEKSSRKASIPTAFLEDGSHSNDHRIKEPLVLSISGEVSSVFAQPNPIIRDFQRAQAEIGNITQYTPERTQSQLSVIGEIANDISDAIRRADAILDSGTQAIEYLGLQDDTSRSNQEKFVDTLESLHLSDALFPIDMPYRKYENMSIVSLEITRDNESKALKFSLEAQQFRFNETVFVENRNPSDGLDGQVAGQSNKGTQEGREEESSFLSYLLGD